MTRRSDALKTAGLTIALLFGFALRGRAQSAEGYTDILYDEFSGEMRAFAITCADYDTLYYYVPQVHMMFMKQHDYYPYNVWLGESYGTGGQIFDYALASVSAEYEAGVPYSAFAEHSIDIYFYDEGYSAWYDFYGYGLLELPYPWDLPRFEVWVWVAPIIAVYEYIQSLNLGQTAMENVIPPEPTVSITSAVIPDDSIAVQLAPQGISGTLTVQLVQGGTTHTLYQGTKTGGSHNISFNIPNLPNGEFSQVRATWAVGGQNPSGTYGYHFKVLGTYTQTQYNTPAESSCTGDPTPVTVYNGSCVITPDATVKSGFFFRVTNPTGGTGSGYSIWFGVVKPEAWCPGRPVPPQPPGLRRDQTITGSMGPVNNSTVAVAPNSEMHVSGTQLYIHGVGVKTVTDTCNACIGVNKIDNYTTDTACSGIGSLSDAKTIILY